MKTYPGASRSHGILAGGLSRRANKYTSRQFGAIHFGSVSSHFGRIPSRPLGCRSLIPVRTHPRQPWIDKLCAVGLDDGRVIVRKVPAGSRNGLYDLESPTDRDAAGSKCEVGRRR
jgi:hypothetical protein